MPNPVVHFEIISKNAENLRSFYRDAFQWDIASPIPGSPVDYSLVPRDASGGIGGGIGQVCAHGGEGHVTFYMGSDQVPNGPVIGMFRDPEQHVIGVVQIQ